MHGAGNAEVLQDSLPCDIGPASPQFLCQRRLNQGHPAGYPLDLVSWREHSAIRALDQLASSLAAAYLGARVSVFSNIGRDYPRGILSLVKNHGIDVSGVKKLDGLTTRFRISYSADSRRLELINPGQKIKPRSTRDSLHAIHLGPVFLEIGLDTLHYARYHSKFLSLDVQGLLRTEGPKGFVRLARKGIDQFLSKCNLVKATEDEA